MWAFFMFILAVPVVAIALVVINKSKQNQINNAAKGPNDPFNLSNLNEEEKAVYDKVVAFVGHPYITQEDIKAYQIHSIVEAFTSIPGGDFWDESVHNAPGQYDRLHRAVLEPPWLIALDRKSGLANLLGASDNYYLTSVRRCSCQDYGYRKLPCKHMYWLAIALSSDEELEIHGNASHPLIGLKFATAGRFPDKGKDSFIKQLQSCGAKVESVLTRESSALVFADGHSDGKLSMATDLDMEILSVDEAMNLFKAY